MNKIKFLLLLLIPFVSFSQNEFEYKITVLDSFTTSKIGQEGVLHVRSIEHEGKVHLSYILKDTSAVAKLYYGIRNSSGLVSELVASFPQLHNYYPHTSLQIDSMGNPIIYIAYISKKPSRNVYAYTKNGNGWDETLIASTKYSPYEQVVMAPSDGSEIGCVFTSESEYGFINRISYAYFDGSNWNVEHISEDLKRARTLPSVVSKNGKVYVIYGEGLAPDTMITRVMVKDNGNWSIDYEEEYPTAYGGGGILGLYTKIGAYDNGLVFIHSLHNNPQGHPTFMRNEGPGWKKEDIVLNHVLTDPARGQNIMFDQDETAYWINQTAYVKPRLSWKKKNGEVGFIDLPHFHGALLLWDAVLIDDIFYIYYTESNTGWPYGNPVTFKEIQVTKSSIFTTIQETNAPKESFKLNVLPNPFTDKFSVEIISKQRTECNLKLYDTKGILIETLYTGKLEPGKNIQTFYPNKLSNSVYILVLEADGNRTTNLLINQK